MKAERMIEILNEVTGNPNTVKYKDEVTCSEALTAMQRISNEWQEKYDATTSALNRFRIEDAGSALDEQNRLRTELENERIRHAACGVLAMSNTPETLAKNREMNAEYLSASAQDVIRCVEENISLRAELERLKQCEAIVRELAEWSERYPISQVFSVHHEKKINGQLNSLESTARQWVKENPPHTGR